MLSPASAAKADQCQSRNAKFRLLTAVRSATPWKWRPRRFSKRCAVPPWSSGIRSWKTRRGQRSSCVGCGEAEHVSGQDRRVEEMVGAERQESEGVDGEETLREMLGGERTDRW